MDPQFRQTTTSGKCFADIECTLKSPYNSSCKRSGENPRAEKYLRHDSFPTTKAIHNPQQDSDATAKWKRL
jgi:hypothetical protein